MTRDEITGASRESGGMFAVIPGVVMQDRDLPKSAWMLYGIITWKCNNESRCWPTNRALGEELNISASRVSALLSLLEKKGHIETELVIDPATGQVLRRYIYPIVKSGKGISKNNDTPPPENEDTPPQKCGDPPPKNNEEKYKVKYKDKPPKAPQGGRGALPKWKPERFAAFWDYYRQHARGEARMNAARAWDKLKPDDALIRTMAHALTRQVESEDWRRGVGIPYAATWLNNRRWEDAPPPPKGGGDPDGPVRVVEKAVLPVW